MKIIIGADVAGFELKEQIKSHFEGNSNEIIDIGMYNADTQIPYYEVAANAAGKIQSGEADKAILFCGTGMGVAIVSNKFKGVYAGVVESEFGGRHCKVINNCNVLTMGGWVVSSYRAKKIVDSWLSSGFTEGYEDIAEFLRNAEEEVKKIEEEQRA